MKCLIVGNGPSLNDTPLEDINVDLRFGLNRIHLIYNDTKWRPDVYVYGDRSRPVDGCKMTPDIQFHLNMGYPCYVRADLGRQGEFIELEQPLYWYPNYHPFVECSHSTTQGTAINHWHPPHPCKQGGSAYIAAQLAVLEYDATEIYFVGCDLGYKAYENNNFHPDYHHNDAYNARTVERTDKILRDGHRIIEAECRKRRIKVFNATVGGELEEYPRIDVEELCQ